MYSNILERVGKENGRGIGVGKKPNSDEGGEMITAAKPTGGIRKEFVMKYGKSLKAGSSGGKTPEISTEDK